MRFFHEEPISRHRLPKPAEQALLKRFFDRYQLEDPEPKGGLTRLTWPWGELLMTERVLKSPVLRRARPLYVLLEFTGAPEIYATTWRVAASYFYEDHIQYEHYLFDDSLDWCLVISHDDFLYLMDPQGLFGEYAERVPDDDDD